MKTFQEFLYEATVAQRIKARALQLLVKHKDNPEKFEVYKAFIKRLNERDKPAFPEYAGRTSSRRDKHLYPSGRMSSHPGEENPSTVTRNPKKLRKQRALGEIS
jgi:hypothetical protein